MHKNNPTVAIALLAAACLSHATSVVAAGETTSSSPIIVTATRTAQTADETLAPVTVITREEIRQSQAGNLTELLAGSPGIDVTETGWYGQSSNYFIRGTSAKHILVLIDGVPLGSATTGSTELVDIGLDHIERIEIVRGPRSSLYGSSAIGGVIQVITTPTTEDAQASIDVGYGSYNTRSLASTISAGNDKTRVRFSLSGLTTEGTDVSADNNPDDDGYEVERVSTSLRHELTERSTIDVSAYQSRSTIEYDGFMQSSAYTKEALQRTLSSSLSVAPLDEWEMRFRANKSNDESDNFQDGALNGVFHTQREQLGWQNDVMLSDSALLTFGLDKITESIESQTAYSETERSVTGSFAEIQQGYERHDILLSVRSDNYDALGRHTTGNIDWGYSLSDSLRLTAGYGTAFKAPTFNDLYYPVQPWGEGNPDLEPESSVSYEAGIRGRHATVDWTLNLFRTEIKDLIEWQCVENCAVAPTWDDVYKPFNVSRATINGLETGITAHHANSEIKLGLTLLDATDEESGNTLQNRPGASLRLDLNHQSGNWRSGMTLLAQSARYADSDNSRKLGGYTTVDLRTDYALDKHWRIRGKIRNLFDKEYLTTDTSFQPLGRSFLVNIGYNIGQDG